MARRTARNDLDPLRATLAAHIARFDLPDEPATRLEDYPLARISGWPQNRHGFVRIAPPHGGTRRGR